MEELEELNILEEEINHTSILLTDLESLIQEDVIVNTAIILNHNINDINGKYVLDLELLDNEDNPVAKYNHDAEGIKNLIESVIEKYDKLLIKFQLFVRKLFLKMLNIVSLRSSTIDKLIEELPTISENKMLTLKLSRPLSSIIKGDTYNTYPIKIDMNMEKVLKYFKEGYDKNEEIHKVLASASSDLLSSSLFNNLAREIEKDDIRGLKFTIPVRLNAHMYRIAVSKTGAVVKNKVKLPSKTNLKHGTSKDMETMLKLAKEENEDFKHTIDDIFSILKDVEDFEIRSKDVNPDSKVNKQKQKFAMQYYKSIKDLLPWMAYHSGMHIHTHIGYVIGIAKDFSKKR